MENYQFDKEEFSKAMGIDSDSKVVKYYAALYPIIMEAIAFGNAGGTGKEYWNRLIETAMVKL